MTYNSPLSRIWSSSTSPPPASFLIRYKAPCHHIPRPQPVAVHHPEVAHNCSLDGSHGHRTNPPICLFLQHDPHPTHLTSLLSTPIEAQRTFGEATVHFSTLSESTWNICSVTTEGHLRNSLGDHQVPWKEGEMDGFEIRALGTGEGRRRCRRLPIHAKRVTIQPKDLAPARQLQSGVFIPLVLLPPCHTQHSPPIIIIIIITIIVIIIILHSILFFNVFH
jgi:hypothetical protein